MPLPSDHRFHEQSTVSLTGVPLRRVRWLFVLFCFSHLLLRFESLTLHLCLCVCPAQNHSAARMCILFAPLSLSIPFPSLLFSTGAFIACVFSIQWCPPLLFFSLFRFFVHSPPGFLIMSFYQPSQTCLVIVLLTPQFPPLKVIPWWESIILVSLLFSIVQFFKLNFQSWHLLIDSMCLSIHSCIHGWHMWWSKGNLWESVLAFHL